LIANNDGIADGPVGQVLSGRPEMHMVRGFKMLLYRFKKHNFRLLPSISDFKRDSKLVIGSMRVYVALYQILL